MNQNQNTDIAIIGMAALFPKAPDVRTFWSNILHKVDGVGPPDPRWVDEVFHDPDSREINRIYTTRGGFLNELSRFNPATFRIMPVSLLGGEPDQFHALQLASDALTDAGYADGEFDAENTGIILGHSVHANRGNTSGIQHGIVLDQTLGLFKSLYPDLSPEKLAAIGEMLRKKLPPADVDAVPGLVPNMMTGRIANRLNLMGPNYILDAACASASLAVEMSMLELQAGRAKMMLAGGINTSTSPLVYMIFCQLEALSRSSKIRPFAREADGTLLGEGAGILLLKRLGDALDEGDRVYAVIKGVGQSSDGRGKGLMAPRLEGELMAIRRAYETTGIPPESIGLIEAHGTGIPLGDRTEIEALTRAIGTRRGSFPRCAIGSVKSMIGHCIPAAGSAGLIKASLALHHRVLPPTICGEVNPDLQLEATPFFVNAETRPWIHAGQFPRRAAVNAFGFGGINSHVILEEAPAHGPAEAFGLRLPRPEEPAELALFAAESREALVAALEQLKEELAQSRWPDLRGAAAHLWHGKGDGPFRLSLVCCDLKDLGKKADKALARLTTDQRPSFKTKSGIRFQSEPPEGKLAFLFPGEGSQYPEMLRGLALRFPDIRRWFDFLDRLFGRDREVIPSHAIFPLPGSVTEEQRETLRQALLEMDLGSESVFVADQAMMTLLTGFGLKPQVMVGHSTGETSALVASGIPQMNEDDVGGYISEMNRLYQELNSTDDIPRGVLLSVGGVDRELVDRLLAEDQRLRMTMDNCLNQVILFGPQEAVDTALPQLKEAGGICLALPFGRAYHTEEMGPMARAFSGLFKDIALVPNEVVLYSCATAAPFPGDEAGIRETIERQYVTPVHFRETIERMHDDGVRYFVEVGPKSVLTGFVRDILTDREHLAIASNHHRRNDQVQLMRLLGSLFVHRHPVDLGRLYPEAEPAPPARKPGMELPSHVPFISFDEAEADALRRLLPREASAASGPAPTAAAPAPPAGGDREEVVRSHFDLMNDFLQQQNRLLATRRQRGADPAPVMPVDEAERNWDQVLQLPFTAAIHFLPTGEGERLMPQLRNILGPAELEQWPPTGKRKRQAEWLAGRAAVKEAVRRLCAGAGAAVPHTGSVELVPDPVGRILLGGNWPAGCGDPPEVSLSHLDGAAVGIAAPAGTRVGIDLEREGRIRVEPDDFAEMAFTLAEQARLPRDSGWERRALLFWTAKEAAGQTLSPLAFEVVPDDNDHTRAAVLHEGQRLAVRWTMIGNWLCSVAFHQATP